MLIGCTFAVLLFVSGTGEPDRGEAQEPRWIAFFNIPYKEHYNIVLYTIQLGKIHKMYLVKYNVIVYFVLYVVHRRKYDIL